MAGAAGGGASAGGFGPPQATELPGRTLGVIGLGAIGSLVADAAFKLGMNVVGFDPGITVEAAWRLPAQVKKAASVDDLLRQSDFVSLHVPLIDATKNLINAERIAAMRHDAILLNFAREGTVDNAAVVEALNAGKLAAYICDFPANALKGHPKVVTLPHLGASTEEAQVKVAQELAETLRDFFLTGAVRNAVNLPALDAEQYKELEP